MAAYDYIGAIMDYESDSLDEDGTIELFQYDDDLTRVSGPKVSAFYANLCGNFQRVTIDVWAARAAGESESIMNHLDRERYKCLERAYQSVARELYFAPAELQAIVWIVQRGHGEGTMAGTNQPRWAKE